MHEQLKSSLDFDVQGDDEVRQQRPKPAPTEQWYQTELKRTAESLRYATEHRAQVIAHAAETNAWLEQLWAALPEDPTK